MVTLTSTPAGPTRIRRDVDGIAFELTPAGLTIEGASDAPIVLNISAALALADFLRTPGARPLIVRAWLAEEHAAGIERAELRRAA